MAKACKKGWFADVGTVVSPLKAGVREGFDGVPFGVIVEAFIPACKHCGLQACGYFLLNKSLFQRVFNTIGGLDFLKERPGGLTDLVGQPLNRPGAAGGIDHACEFTFLLKDQMRVAGDAADCIDCRKVNII